MTQKIVDYDFLNSNNDNNIIVRLKTSDLDSDNTYYIKLVYNGIIWDQSNGQRIIVGYGNNSSISGDNGNNNNNGSIDTIGIENKLNLINDTIKSGDNAIISKLNNIESGEQSRFQYWQNEYINFFNYSGDYSGILQSGDFLGITMNYDDYDNWGFGDFVVDLFQNIIYTLNSSQDTTINFGFLGDINSADFKINNSTINSFVGIFSNGLFLLMIIFFYYRLIKAIASLNIDKLAKYDFDSLFNLF